MPMRAQRRGVIVLLAAGSMLTLGAGQGPAPTVTPLSDFRGRIGTTAADSQPDALPVVRAPVGSPNIVYILFDDVGFSDLGSTTSTPLRSAHRRAQRS
jgi:hypothetical protein